MSTPDLPATLPSTQIASLPPSAYYIPSFLTPAEETHLLEKLYSVPQPTWRHLSHRRLQAHPSPLSASNTLLDAPLPSWLAEPIIPRLLSLTLATPTSTSASTAQSESGGESDPGAQSRESELTTGHVFTASPHGRPNHVLVNEYAPGQGIMPHEDGAAYFPVVCTVSLGAGVVYNAYPKPKTGSPSPSSSSSGSGSAPEARMSMRDGGTKWRIYQEPGSLLVTTGEMYTGCLHGIEDVVVDEDVTEDGVVNWGLLREETREAMERGGGRNERGTRVSLTYRDVLKVKRVGRAFGVLGR